MAEQQNKRATDDILFQMASDIGEIRGRQDQIIETQKSQLEHREEDREAHDKIFEKVGNLEARMSVVPDDQHRTDHEWVREQAGVFRERKEMCRRAKMVMIERALPYAILAMIGIAFYLMGAKEWGAWILAKMKL